MKPQQSFVLFVVALLCCVIGCAKQHRELAGGILFEVDGEKYWLDRRADVDKAGNVATSSLSVRPYSELGAVTWKSEYTSARGTTITTMIVSGKPITPQTNTLYFIQDGRIAFEKKYQDLKIDSQRLNAENKEMLDYLQPILEAMIREADLPHPPKDEAHEPRPVVAE